MISVQQVNRSVTPSVTQRVITERVPVNFQMNVTSQRKEITFDYTDTSELSKAIGSIPAGLSIHKLRLDILTAFEAGIFFTIGDVVAQGRLMTAAQNNPQAVHSYIAEPDYAYATATNVKIYFGGGEATVGSGRIIIYYS
jgi:hypothetical protein